MASVPIGRQSWGCTVVRALFDRVDWVISLELVPEAGPGLPFPLYHPGSIGPFSKHRDVTMGV